MRTVIVPLDGSALAEQALPWATALAHRSGAPMLLVSIIDIPVEYGAWGAGSAMALGNELDTWVASQKTYLDALASKITDTTVTTIARVGMPGSELLNIINGTDAPIVVMSSHGRTGARRLLLGSVANRIVREANCPVMVIRGSTEQQATAQPATFDKILVPLDGSEFAERALTDALDVIDGSQLDLHLVRVVEIPSLWMPGPDVPIDYGLVQEYTDAVADEAQDYIAKLGEKLKEDGRTVTWEVRDGQPAQEILRAAETFGASVIAMSTHGRGGIGRLFFGSVAERVLHEATVPLLLIRPRD
jgi:nucleotide-binding universal stress UspA family protein